MDILVPSRVAFLAFLPVDAEVVKALDQLLPDFEMQRLHVGGMGPAEELAVMYKIPDRHSIRPAEVEYNLHKLRKRELPLFSLKCVLALETASTAVFEFRRLKLVVEEGVGGQSSFVGTASYLFIFGALTVVFWVAYRRGTIQKEMQRPSPVKES